LSEDLKAEVIIGDDAETFVISELGKTILGMAKQDFENAMHAFCEVDVTDARAVARIQQDARVAKAVDRYLVELIQRGREALEAFKQQT
jgi:hypothetical protein